MDQSVDKNQSENVKKNPEIARRGRWIRKPSEFVFADISLETGISKLDLSERQFKLMLISAMKSTFGDFGLAIPIDIIKFQPDNLRAYIRFPGKQFIKIQCALTLLSSWEGIDVNIVIHKVTHSLPALHVNSYHQEHDIIKQF
ncbi:ribonuclease P protein subunit p14-like [Brevipalpus obovatus]|uniref:ribonuclease P protein subunit p14-like n=1 Tax=Brevipalpus obovatus TaxID=246614 RepID=UPI003D9E8337